MRRLRVGPRTPIAACEGLPLPRRRAPPRAGRGADRDLVVLPTRRPARLTDVSPRPCWAPCSTDARAGLLLRAALEAASPRLGCIAASMRSAPPGPFPLGPIPLGGTRALTAKPF